jgi:hypothetical protein
MPNPGRLANLPLSLRLLLPAALACLACSPLVATEFRVLGEEIDLPTPPRMTMLAESDPLIAKIEAAQEQLFAKLPAKDRPSQRTTRVIAVYERRTDPNKALMGVVMPCPMPDVFADQHHDESSFARASLSDRIPDEKTERHRFYWKHPEANEFSAYLLCRGKVLFVTFFETVPGGKAQRPSDIELAELKHWIAEVERTNPATGTGLLDPTTVSIVCLLGSIASIFYWINRAKLRAKGEAPAPIPPGIL